MPYVRRQFLGTLGAFAASSALSPLVFGAVGESSGILAPRMGLVIGNSNYSGAQLANPANDAKAIAEALGELGFQCQLLLNAGAREMEQAINRYGALLAEKKAVGLFYYAGHGAQLAWRNYLIPVDSHIRSLNDIPNQAVELNLLLSTLKRAANPMNVIILDACRDNPFGDSVPVEQKGLSQFDAPNGSLLSYATAPGNTASDGEGKNGLFTENLLREMRVSGAKLEDVFKRVRLKVRLKSQGMQVPWESTSLEEDFYFVQDKTAAEPVASADDKAKQFSDELAFWTSAQQTATVPAVEAYLVRYPNGSFSQLAQVLLDSLLQRRGEKKVQAVSSSGNPFSKGSANAVGNYTLGDSYQFERRDLYTDVVESVVTDIVSDIAEGQIVFNGGELILDLLGNELKSRSTRFLSPAQFFPAEYGVGHKWRTQYGWIRRDGVPSEMDMQFRIVGRERFTNSAGSFDAFVVNGMGYVSGGGNSKINYLIDPDRCLRPLRMDVVGRNRRGKTITSLRTELVAFTQQRTRSSG
jgi:uncharacterized caspase-like protein